MKKLLLVAVGLLMTLTASAQFEADKVYIGGSLTGLNLSYNGKNGMGIGVQAQAGYLIQDNWMLLANASYQHTGSDAVSDYISVGVGARYYIIQNGLYLGLNAKLVHAYHNYNDLMPGLEIGYAFFISHTVTIEPAIYYDQSFKNHSDYSTIGLKVGVGIYL